LSSKSEY